MNQVPKKRRMYPIERPATADTARNKGEDCPEVADTPGKFVQAELQLQATFWFGHRFHFFPWERRSSPAFLARSHHKTG